MENNNSKMSLLSGVSLCIGAVIGSGIFGSLPSAIALSGTGIVWAIVISTVVMIIRTLPALIPTAAIPAPAAYYKHLTRLVNPVIGWLIMVKLMFNIFVLALLATVFAKYFTILVPMNGTVAGIGALLLFGVISYFGINLGSKAQDVMVVILIIALFSFIFCGFSNLKPELVSFSSVIAPSNMTFVSLGATVGLMVSCLTGGDTITNYCDSIRNPGRNVLLSFLLGTCGAALIYSLMAVVAVGVLPAAEATELAIVAEAIMPGWLYMFFVVGGALLAVSTTINAVQLATTYQISVIAEDKVFPQIVEKKNKYGISTAAVVIVVAAGVLIVLFNLSVFTLLSVSSVLGVFISLVQFIPALKLPQKYPNCYANSPIKYSKGVLYTIMLVALALCIWQSYSSIVTASGAVWIILIAVLVSFYVYLFLRKAYLAKKGIDLFALMSMPVAAWEEKEKNLDA